MSRLERDRAIQLAKSDACKALKKATAVSDPWYRAQALAWVAKYTDGSPLPIAALAAKAALACRDDYQRSAVRAWEIAALAERDCVGQAKKALREAVERAKNATPVASRSEAFLLLLQAALKIDHASAVQVSVDMKQACPAGEHWRCKRAIKSAAEFLENNRVGREFFW